MSENLDGLAYNEEAYSVAFSPGGVDASERLKHPWHLVHVETNSRVVHFDANGASHLATADQNAAARIGVLDGVGQQVAQNGTEQQFVTLNTRAGSDHAKLDAFFQGVKFAFATDLLNQLSKRQRPQLHSARFAKAESGNELIELSPHSIDGALTCLQLTQFRSGSKTCSKKIVRILEHLKGLSKVVSRYRQQNGFKARDSLRARIAAHVHQSPRWSL